ncbi:phosphonate C-P lyase system protein PhnH [Alteribacillus sp. YIM 98480]|uniref:phosphonate C-P lyase system protein PhnH n=1 Tax=Alteribacillus sp. YIM 98480 TaxID=2606599 RepID=UPI00131BC682|nr:phosphonate C-P lyase system protein PhnH [Alteribacillus sp. YIM 98480]
MIKTTNKGFDKVHDSQQIFRNLVEAFSRPGKTVNILPYCNSINPPQGFSAIMTGLAFTLVDREVTFSVLHDHADGVEQYIHWQTFCNQTAPKDADYIFVDQYMDENAIDKLMDEVKIGTLTHPHQSATLFLKINEFDQKESEQVTLSGPGINGEKSCNIGLCEKWITTRNELTAEYPLGIDLCLVNENGDLLALPRTTKIQGG